MTRMENIQDFLAQKRFAFVGVSSRPKDFSRALFLEFQVRHYEPVPVHPEAAEIEGAPCFAHLRDIQPPVDSVLLMTSPAVTNLVVRECVEAGVKRVWFYRGGGKGAAHGDCPATLRGQRDPRGGGRMPFYVLRQHAVVSPVSRAGEKDCGHLSALSAAVPNAGSRTF